MELISLRNMTIGAGQPLTVISGPCVIEGEEETLQMASALQEIFRGRPLQLIFKASYDKANRSSIRSFRGPGLARGLHILQRVQAELHLPVLTDVHSPEEAEAAGHVCDVIQIPAFLCRQTDLIAAAAKTPAVVNIKKGQFLAPWDMQNIVDKFLSMGHRRLILTDRGTSFGYNNLVSDFRAIPIMQKCGFPVCFDASHSVQLPGGLGATSGGQREFIPTLAYAAVAAGCDVLFLESHPNPSLAKSDAESVMPLSALPHLLSNIERLHAALQPS